MNKPDINIKIIIEMISENPGRLFGLLYPYILVLGTGIGIYYLGQINNVARQVVPPLLPDTTVVNDLSIVEAKSVPPIDIIKLSVPTPELIAKGKTLFSASCSTCHGEEGTGTGPGSVGLNPAPRNFTVSENWKNGSTLTGIYQSLEEGIAGSGMISYNFMLPEERIALAHYIRSTFVSDAKANTNDELLAMDQLYSLSKGTEIAAQIPVKSAVELITKKESEVQNRIEKSIEQIKSNSTDTGSKLFLDVTSDPVKALSSLNNSLNWKNSEENFIKTVIANVNQNGFKTSVAGLNKSEWNTLFNFLSRTL
ncbi:MAG: cytochrome c [Ignavibacteriales bacterium]|nr:MAG: cytochrome c [Ignavibacteriales bacterium]